MSGNASAFAQTKYLLIFLPIAKVVTKSCLCFVLKFLHICPLLCDLSSPALLLELSIQHTYTSTLLTQTQPPDSPSGSPAPQSKPIHGPPCLWKKVAPFSLPVQATSSWSASLPSLPSQCPVTLQPRILYHPKHVLSPGDQNGCNPTPCSLALNITLPICPSSRLQAHAWNTICLLTLHTNLCSVLHQSKKSRKHYIPFPLSVI